MLKHCSDGLVLSCTLMLPHPKEPRSETFTTYICVIRKAFRLCEIYLPLLGRHAEQVLDTRFLNLHLLSVPLVTMQKPVMVLLAPKNLFVRFCNVETICYQRR